MIQSGVKRVVYKTLVPSEKWNESYEYSIKMADETNMEIDILKERE